MASGTPQLEDGFVRIANELYDAILLAPFSKRELLIVLAVIRKTYGYGKRSDDMTMTQLAGITGLTRAHVSETVRDLALKNVILIRDGEYGKVIALSKDYKKWNFQARPETGTSQNGTRPKTGSLASRNGINGVPKRDPERPDSGSTIDNSKRQPQKTTPKDISAEASPSAATWAAYAAAYEARYGVAPSRSATVNSQLANFVSRIPRADAPAVAAFYVGHNDAYYIKRGHQVGVMLRDAEKLRTEWFTNRKTTQTAAHQADRREAAAQVWGPMIEEAEDAHASET